MKKTTRVCCLLLCLLIVMASITLTGCSRNPGSETKMKGFQYATLSLPDGTIIFGKLQNYHSYSNGTVELKIDEVWYKTHFSNVALFGGNYNDLNEESE